MDEFYLNKSPDNTSQVKCSFHSEMDLISHEPLPSVHEDHSFERLLRQNGSSEFNYALTTKPKIQRIKSKFLSITHQNLKFLFQRIFNLIYCTQVFLKVKKLLLFALQFFGQITSLTNMIKWSKIKLQTWMIKTGKLKVESEINN